MGAKTPLVIQKTRVTVTVSPVQTHGDAGAVVGGDRDVIRCVAVCLAVSASGRGHHWSPVSLRRAL